MTQTRKQLFGPILFVLMAVLCLVNTANAQFDKDFRNLTTIDPDNALPGRCWFNAMMLHDIRQALPNEKKIIVIARLGAKERNASMNKRRLHNVRTILTMKYEDAKTVPMDSIIVAEGERTKGRGRVEFYVDGNLILALTPYGDHDLAVTGCYDSVDGGDWCATTEQKQFYPCKDQPKKKPDRKLRKKAN
ncbi:MAG: hypothetical protein JNL64_05890 [Blastocatellia bacterium]|nr:hypothetical protein [Blastocatellia bacterium]